MKRIICCLLFLLGTAFLQNMSAMDSYPEIVGENIKGYFQLAANHSAAAILVDKDDYGVVHIAAGFLGGMAMECAQRLCEAYCGSFIRFGRQTQGHHFLPRPRYSASGTQDILEPVFKLSAFLVNSHRI